MSVPFTDALEAAKPHPRLYSLRSGASFISYIFKDILGIDPVYLVNASFVVAAVTALWQYMRGTLYQGAKNWCLSSATIHDSDPLYHTILRWMAEKHLPALSSQSAKVITVKTVSLEDDESSLHLLEKEAGKNGDVTNYRAMVGRSPVEFQFEQIQHLFRHRGRFFYFKHARNSHGAYRRIDPYNNDQLDVCSLSFECFGRTAAPIKTLILDAQSWDLARPRKQVRICRAISNPNFFIERPARQIDTVILDADKKNALLKDMNEYLHPRTRRWYHTHGIPYRRGYLLSGPPGCGKTSLTAALAGLFGLDLYTISLLEPHVNEGSLTNFFFNLSTRCIVLMEDIDAAGLKRDEDDDSSSAYNMMMPQAMHPYYSRKKTRMAPVSLSGLLNALDGVASHEGRIVIMTSNHPEKLDEALIRPGRVDMHIRFELPVKAEMRDLFTSMYQDTTKAVVTPTGPATIHPSANVTEDDPPKRVYTEDEVSDLADTFANSLPEKALSLAAIQGFLLKYKSDPTGAAENSKQWGEETVEAQRQAEIEERQKVKAEAKKLAEMKVDAARVEAEMLEEARVKAEEKAEAAKRRVQEKEEERERKAATDGLDERVESGQAEAGAETQTTGNVEGEPMHEKREGKEKLVNGVTEELASETDAPKVNGEAAGQRDQGSASMRRAV